MSPDGARAVILPILRVLGPHFHSWRRKPLNESMRQIEFSFRDPRVSIVSSFPSESILSSPLHDSTLLKYEGNIDASKVRAFEKWLAASYLDT